MLFMHKQKIIHDQQSTFTKVKKDTNPNTKKLITTIFPVLYTLLEQES